MKRLHLFEFHDQAWFPGFLRELLTDFLSYCAVNLKPYEPVVPFVLPLMQRLGQKQIVDLCSGGGGPAESFLQTCRANGNSAADVRIVLTDKYPNRKAYQLLQDRYQGAVSYFDRPLDASEVPEDLKGFRTLFTSFHHFRPETARKILADAVGKRQPIGVFEYTERNFLIWTLPLLASPVYVWLVTPWMRPFSWKRLFWTYLVPVLPVVAAWDGLVSCLRTYSPAELLELSEAATKDHEYNWQAGRLRSFGGCHITYLIGMPR